MIEVRLAPHVDLFTRRGGLNTPVSAHVLHIIDQLRYAYAAEGMDHVYITSLCDGKHGALKSKHYRGDGVDVRTFTLPGGYTGPAARRIVADMKKRLGDQYDVVLEGNHIHIEYDPHGYPA